MNVRISRKLAGRIGVVALAIAIGVPLLGCGSFGRSTGGMTELPGGVVSSVTVRHSDGDITTCVIADTDSKVRQFTPGKEYCLGGRPESEKQCKKGDTFPNCSFPQGPSTPPSTKPTT